MFEEHNKVKRVFKEDCGRFAEYFQIASDIRKCRTEPPPRRIAAGNVILYIAQRRNVHELQFRDGQIKYRMECLRDISVVTGGLLRGKQLAGGLNSNGRPSATSKPTGMQKNRDQIAQDIRALQSEIDGNHKQVWKDLAAVRLDAEPLLTEGLPALDKPKDLEAFPNSGPNFRKASREIIYLAYIANGKTTRYDALAGWIDEKFDASRVMEYWQDSEEPKTLRGRLRTNRKTQVEFDKLLADRAKLRDKPDKASTASVSRESLRDEFCKDIDAVKVSVIRFESKRCKTSR